MEYSHVKIVVYVPVENAEQLREVIGNTGAGKIGNYSHCSFSSTGWGRFKPGEGADPYIGSVGKMEQVQEERIEFVCPKEKVKEVVDIIKECHPYEEVVLDIYPLLDI
ncbi:hypothetical protein H6776_02040 [Candidatus Nomurabacteria bacterium]|nr:hypothetical protein [Candidatus Nomurabacteria bacterium]